VILEKSPLKKLAKYGKNRGIKREKDIIKR
jgi:hypothetical protein